MSGPGVDTTAPPFEIIVDLEDELLIELDEPFTLKYRSGKSFTSKFYLIKVFHMDYSSSCDPWDELMIFPCDENGKEYHSYPMELGYLPPKYALPLARRFPTLAWFIEQYS